MLVSELFKPENIKIDLESSDKEELFEEMVNFLADVENLNIREEILKRIWERERKMTTGIAPNIAIPHTHIPNINRTIGVMGISRRGIDYDSLDGKPIHLVMLLIGDDKEPENHLKILKNIALLLNNPDFYPSIMKCKTEKEISETIVEFEEEQKFNS